MIHYEEQAYYLLGLIEVYRVSEECTAAIFRIKDETRQTVIDQQAE
jgi:hypothetical protein